jgi:GT2 family glycosyltransferase
MISVVIPVLVVNEDLLLQAKRAVNSIRTKNTKIILVDNGSTVGSDWFKDNADIYLRYPSAIGFGAACNAGIKESKGEFIVISSIDVEYRIGSVDDLAAILQGEGILCPSSIDKGQAKSEELYLNNTFGATFMLSRKTYDKVKLPEGLYDERYEHGYFEDMDLWYRCDELGIPLVRTGRVLVFHGQGTTNKTLGVLDKFMEINKQKFIDKWGKEGTWRG